MSEWERELVREWVSVSEWEYEWEQNESESEIVSEWVRELVRENGKGDDNRERHTHKRYMDTGTAW